MPRNPRRRKIAVRVEMEFHAVDAAVARIEDVAFPRLGLICWASEISCRWHWETPR